MAISMMSRVWETAPYKAEKLIVLLALADWSDEDGNCFPSYSKIAAKARVSKQGAIQIIQALIQDKAIEISETGHGRGNHHSYRLLPQNWASIKGQPERIKGQREPSKGKPASPFTEKKKVNQKPEKVNQDEIKGQPETIKGQPEQVAYKEEPSYEPSIDPSGEPSLYAAPSGARVGGHQPAAEILTLVKPEPPSSDWMFKKFQEHHAAHYGIPFSRPSRRGRGNDFGVDFVLMANLKSGLGEFLTKEIWQQACENYFATPQKSHTPAKLCEEFSAYQASSFDRFAKPVRQPTATTEPSMAHLSEIGQRNAAMTQSWLERKYGNG